MGINLLVREVPRAHLQEVGVLRDVQGGAERGRGGGGGSFTHLVVHVKPLGMVVQLFSLQGHSRHEAKSLIK